MNKLRREDRAISEQEALEILHKGEYGILSMCTLKNEGYGIPLHYVMDGDKIYFHCARVGSKMDYLRNNSKVSFCVVGRTEVMPSEFATLYESAIVSGETTEVGDDEKREALTLLIAKYSGDYKEEGNVYIEKLFDRVAIIKMSVTSVSGKARKL